MTLNRSLTLAAIAASLFVTPSLSHAQRGPGGMGNFYLEGAFTPILQGANESIQTGGGSFPGEGNPGTDSTTGYDVRTTLGYAIGGQYFVGLSYRMMSSTLKREGTISGEFPVSSTEYGPTLGYLYGGWKIMATYILSSEWKKGFKETLQDGSLGSNYDIKNHDGNGFMVNVGYNFSITSWLQLGPSLIYRNVSYAKQTKTNKLDESQSYTDKAFDTKAMQSDLSPYFTIIARF